MKKSVRAVYIAAALVGVLAISGCHGGGTAKTRWVNQADSRQVMEFEIHNPSMLSQVHMALVSVPIRGSYVLKNADTVVEQGKLTVEPPGFVLRSVDGTTRKLALGESGSLKEENGTKWNAEKTSTAALTLKKW